MRLVNDQLHERQFADERPKSWVTKALRRNIEEAKPPSSSLGKYFLLIHRSHPADQAVDKPHLALVPELLNLVTNSAQRAVRSRV